MRARHGFHISVPSLTPGVGDRPAPRFSVRCRERRTPHWSHSRPARWSRARVFSGPWWRHTGRTTSTRFRSRTAGTSSHRPHTSTRPRPPPRSPRRRCPPNRGVVSVCPCPDSGVGPAPIEPGRSLRFVSFSFTRPRPANACLSEHPRGSRARKDTGRRGGRNGHAIRCETVGNSIQRLTRIGRGIPVWLCAARVSRPTAAGGRLRRALRSARPSRRHGDATGGVWDGGRT